MSLGDFNETRDTKQENENVDNLSEGDKQFDKPKNQILETPESLNDNFDSKCEKNETSETNKEKDDTSEKKGLLDWFSNLGKREAKSEQDQEDAKDENSEKSPYESFLDRIRVSPEDMNSQSKDIDNTSEDTDDDSLELDRDLHSENMKSNETEEKSTDDWER